VTSDQHSNQEEWRKNMAAQVPNTKQFPLFKNDIKSKSGIESFSKIIFRFPFFRLIFIDVSCNAVTACRQNP